jgi:hypothetical protein
MVYQEYLKYVNITYVNRLSGRCLKCVKKKLSLTGNVIAAFYRKKLWNLLIF